MLLQNQTHIECLFDRSSIRLFVEENPKNVQLVGKHFVRLDERWYDEVLETSPPMFSCACSVQTCPSWLRHVHQSYL